MCAYGARTPRPQPSGISETVLGDLQALEEDAELFLTDVLGPVCRTRLPRPCDVALGGDEDRHGRLGLGGDPFRDPLLHAADLPGLPVVEGQVVGVVDGGEELTGCAPVA